MHWSLQFRNRTINLLRSPNKHTPHITLLLTLHPQSVSLQPVVLYTSNYPPEGNHVFRNTIMRKTSYSYENSKLCIHYLEESLITVTFSPGITVTEADVKLVDQRVKWLTCNLPHFLIIDISSKAHFPAHVQEYAASLDVNLNKIAEAVIVASGWQARTANLYRNYLRKTHYEQRFFISHQKAHEWIKQRMLAHKSRNAR
ncbi:MAG: hypothetical protein IM607_12400 [Cytophagales bacterium]|nr:hypothetical protein [Cytophagales bacterium]